MYHPTYDKCHHARYWSQNKYVTLLHNFLIKPASFVFMRFNCINTFSKSPIAMHGSHIHTLHIHPYSIQTPRIHISINMNKNLVAIFITYTWKVHYTHYQ